MKDTIYREDAIKALMAEAKGQFRLDASYAYVIGALRNVEDAIRNIPSADRPHGEWIFRREFVEDTPFTGYRCSNCNYWKSMGAWNYCPNCGARMKGADDEITTV